MIGTERTTGRGFPLVEFVDEYGLKCSIQESSRAVCENDDGSVDNPLGWIWLGLDDAHPQIMKSKAAAHGLTLPPGEVSGWMPFPIPEDVLLSTRMHLDEHMVRALIARLQHWLDNGTLHSSNAQMCREDSVKRAQPSDSAAETAPSSG